MVTLILVVLFVVLIYFNFKKLKKERDSDLVELQLKESELFNLVNTTLGTQALEAFKAKKIWVDMPACLIKYSFGLPHEKKEHMKQGTKSETWYYQQSAYNYGGKVKYKYGFEVHISNKLITGWKDN